MFHYEQLPGQAGEIVSSAVRAWGMSNDGDAKADKKLVEVLFWQGVVTTTECTVIDANGVGTVQVTNNQTGQVLLVNDIGEVAEVVPAVATKHSSEEQPSKSNWYKTGYDTWRWYCATTNRWSWGVSEWMMQGTREGLPMKEDQTMFGVEWREAPVPAWLNNLQHL